MADQPSSSKNPNMQWMYEGTKSIVNREDYLLGKKIDKNFELYSDVVVKDKEEEAHDNFFKQKLLQNVAVNNQKISALDVRTVRNEDPLVALKFQEEQKRQQMLNNPLLKLKAQRILQKEFEKQMKKKEKKNKRKKHKKSSTSSSDEETPKKQGREDERSVNRREERREGSTRGFYHHKNSSRSSEELQRERQQSKEKEKTNHSSRSKLSAAEMEEKRKAMLQNSSWRDELRENNFKMTVEQLKKEENETKNVPTFIRPIMDSANSSVEKRLQSNKMGIQRSHDHMEKSFLRR